MLNALTIDVEDYFQVHAFSDVIRYEEWENIECRVERNTNRLLDILDECKSNFLLNFPNSLPQTSVLSPRTSQLATFFVLGWIAERYPNLIRRIKDQGHEIACHGYAHKVIYNQTKEEFREDIRKSKAILEDITGDEVIGYRAPSYSITNKSQWAFEVLVEEGFKYDSSIFPIHHDFYGLPTAPRFPFIISLNGNSNFEFSMLNFELNTAAPQHGSTTALEINSVLITHNLKQQHRNTASQQHVFSSNTLHLAPNPSRLSSNGSLIEFPLSTVQFLGINFPICGGGYFRLFPYSIIRKGLKSINEKENKPFIFYVHPWELDIDQPRIKNASMRSKFRHYVNLNKTENKFRALLKDFNFLPVKEILELNSSLT